MTISLPVIRRHFNVFAGRSELKLLKFNQGPPKSVSFTRPAAGERNHGKPFSSISMAVTELSGNPELLIVYVVK